MTTVLFDPGYSKYVSSFMYFNYETQKILHSLKTPQQKMFKYKQIFPQLFSVLKNEIGFYYACLMWATFIKYSFECAEISDNSFYGKTDEELQSYDYLQEVNYLLEYFEQYPKDLKYYNCKGQQIEPIQKLTVQTYKEFLILNNSFAKTKTTDDIVLPKNINSPTKKNLAIMKDLIDKTVSDGNFERLFEFELLK